MRRAAGLLAVLSAACAPGLPGTGGEAEPTPVAVSGDAMVPPGFGSLRQEEITLTFQDGPLQVKMTPLEEWILRLTAPDTYHRLSELAASHRHEAVRRARLADPTLVLVSFFGREQGASYEPEDVTLLNRGRRFRPVLILPVTGGWGTQRLNVRETQMAVYVFDEAIDLDMGLVAEYGEVRNTAWDGVLQVLQTELARARARAGAF